MRTVRTASRNEVLVLALGCAVAGLMALGTVVVPFSPTAPTGLAAVLGVLGLLLGAALARAGSRTPTPVVHGVLVLATSLVALCVGASTTQAGPAVTASGFVWVALHAAFFLPRRAVVAHLLLVLAGLGLGLHLAGAPSTPQTWWFVGTTLAATAATVHVSVERLRRVAYRDPLTGLVTRASFSTAAEQAMALAARSGSPLTLVLIDLDDFKSVNDTHGHARGDALLVSLARSWQGVLRGPDVLGRHGGDEFVLLLPSTSAAQAVPVLGRMREGSAQARWSAGVAQWAGESWDDWLREADRELYRRKDRRGRGARPVVAAGSRPA